MKKILFFSILTLILAVATVAYAQDEPAELAEPVSSDTAVTPEEEIIAADLGEAEPTVLPTDTFGYFFKNLKRTIQSTLTFDQAKKAELLLKHANERLLEAQKLAEQNPSDEKVQAMIEKAQEKYQKLMEKVQTRVEKLKEKNDARAEKLLDKLADRQLKQQQLMENIQEKMQNLTEEQKAKLEELREKSLERYGQFMEKVEENQQKIKERLEKAAENQEENQLQALRRLKIMEELGDKLKNENFKEGLIEAKEQLREGVVNKLKEQPTTANIQEFKENLEQLRGDEGYKLRVMNFLDARLNERAAAEGVLQRFTAKLEEVKARGEEILKTQLENASTDEQRTELLKPFESGEIHSVEVLERVQAKLKNERAKEALENAQAKQIEQFNRRIEKIEDPARIEKIKEAVEDKPVIRRKIERAVPQIMNRLEQRIENRSNIQPIDEPARIEEPSNVEPDEPAELAETVTDEAEE